MIRELLELAWSFGWEIAGLVSLGWVLVWLGRLSAVATYVRVGVFVGALAIVGALVGVVNVGRALELAAVIWGVLADVLAAASVGVAA